MLLTRQHALLLFPDTARNTTEHTREAAGYTHLLQRARERLRRRLPLSPAGIHWLCQRVDAEAPQLQATQEPVEDPTKRIA